MFAKCVTSLAVCSFDYNRRMLTTPHTAAGIALGAALGNPLLTVPAAITSHFLLDMVPHWQETLAPYNPTWKTYVRVPIDIAMAVAITIFAAHMVPQHAAAIWTGAVAANVPDFDSLVVLVPNIKRGLVQKFWDWHCAIQRETNSLWGILPQLAVILCGLCVVGWLA